MSVGRLRVQLVVACVLGVFACGPTPSSSDAGSAGGSAGGDAVTGGGAAAGGSAAGGSAGGGSAAGGSAAGGSAAGGSAGGGSAAGGSAAGGSAAGGSAAGGSAAGGSAAGGSAAGGSAAGGSAAGGSAAGGSAAGGSAAGGSAAGGSAGGGSTAGGSAGGGSTAGGSAGGGSAGGGSAAGGSAGGGSANCVPQTRMITFDGGCSTALPSPGACGGNVVGNWCYSGYCANGDVIFGAVTAACPTATFSNIAGTVNGTLGFTGTSGAGAVSRNITWTLTGTITFPAPCRAAAGGQCSAIQTLLAQAFLTATCVDQMGGCSCTLANNDNDMSAGSYTTDGGIILNGTRSFEYCVQGTTLRYREFGPQAPEQGVVGTVQK